LLPDRFTSNNSPSGTFKCFQLRAREGYRVDVRGLHCTALQFLPPPAAPPGGARGLMQSEGLSVVKEPSRRHPFS
jgi:hypothetical protein